MSASATTAFRLATAADVDPPVGERRASGPADMRLFYGVGIVGVAALAVFAVAPVGTPWRIGSWFVPMVLATALLALRLRTGSAGTRVPLGLLLGSRICYLAAAFGWYASPRRLGWETSSTSVVDGLFLAAHVVDAAFMAVLLRRRLRERSADRRLALVDAAIFTAAAFALLWVTVIEGQLADGPSGWPMAMALAHPALVLLVFALATRVAVSARGLGSVVAGLLLMAWAGSELLADAFYGGQGSGDAATYAGPHMFLWMASSTAVAMLASHPRLLGLLSADDVDDPPARSASPARGRLRNGLLLAAALLPLALYAMEPGGSVALLAVSGLLFVLVTYRISILAGDLTVQERLAEELDGAVDRLSAQRDTLLRYAAVIDSTDDSIITLSPDGEVVDWNRGAERMYGYTREEALGRPVTFVAAPDDPDLAAEMLATVRRQGPVRTETVDRRKDGSTVQVSVSVSDLRDENGVLLGFVGIARDIGEQKAHEAAAQQESKLESLGRLSAGLAHEINSPIQFVGDNTRFLEDAYQELIRVVEVYRGLLDTANPIGWAERQERVREAEESIDFEYLRTEIPTAVAQTLEGVNRVSTIVRAMKTFSHPGQEEQVPADLNEALEATLTVTRHQVSDVADLTLELAALPPVRCNIAELNQVFLNLVVNAADAIQETGQRGLIAVSTAVEGEDAVVRISDTGGGIPDHVRVRMFEPFFTTKDVGRGSGQGLPLARGVVHEGHGGSLTVDSVVGHGTTFTVRLPIEGRVPARPAPVPA